jgi:hypothetical protein
MLELTIRGILWVFGLFAICLYIMSIFNPRQKQQTLGFANSKIIIVLKLSDFTDRHFLT